MLGLIGHPNVGKSSMVNHLMGDLESQKVWTKITRSGPKIDISLQKHHRIKSMYRNIDIVYLIW